MKNKKKQKTKTE